MKFEGQLTYNPESFVKREKATRPVLSFGRGEVFLFTSGV